MKKRRYSIEVDGNEIIAETDGVQAHVNFKITIDAIGNRSLCDLTISNMTDTTVNSVFKRGAVISLRAGYSDNINYIFTGIIRNVFKGRDGATTSTQILARGGSLEKRLINVSLGKNSKLTTVLGSIADALGYNLVVTDSDFTDSIYTNGYAVTGDPMDLLNRLQTAWDFRYSIENDSLVVFKVETGRSLPVRKVNMINGLEGVPEVTEVGIDFTTRLDPKLKIGAKVEMDTTYKSFNFSGVYYPTQLQEFAGSGTYTIMSIVYNGDNYSNVWSVTCKCYSSKYVEIN
jgi:hypothetical protein